MRVAWFLTKTLLLSLLCRCKMFQESSVLTSVNDSVWKMDAPSNGLLVVANLK